MRAWCLPLFVWLMSTARLARPYPEEIIARYPSPDFKEEAQLVRLTVSSTTYHYKIRILHRYESQAYLDVSIFTWSADSKHFYFVVERYDNQAAVVYDGVEQYTAFKMVSRPIWNADNTQLAYWGWDGNKEFTVMWNGFPIRKYKGIINLFFDTHGKLVMEGEEF